MGAWRNGRRDGFKIHSEQSGEGSNPFAPTNKFDKRDYIKID